MSEKWKPKVGDKVFFNGHGLDGMRRPFRVVGVLDDVDHSRSGQPILEFIGEDEQGFLAKKRGDRSLCAPEFLWPFEWGEAVKAGEANYHLLGADFDLGKWRERQAHPEMKALDACWRHW